MSAPICPMLSALPPVDQDGQPVNRECIYEQCRFFDLERRDCNLLMGSRGSIRLAEEAATRPGSPDLPALVREANQEVNDRIASVESKTNDLGTAVARLASEVAATTDVQQKLADRLLEEMARLGTKTQAIEDSIAGLAHKVERTDEVARWAVQAVETHMKRDQADLAIHDREEAVARNNRGVALYYRGAFEAAADVFRKALELMPDYAEAHNNLGLVLSKLGKEEEAVQAFRSALTIDPKMGEAHNNLGFLYHTSSQFERALQAFGQAIENASDSSIAYTNLGNTFYAMQKPEQALEAWRRALDLDPLNQSARRGLRMFQEEVA